MPRRRGMYSQEGINTARPSDGRWQRGHGVEQDWLPKRTPVGSNVAVLQTQTRSVSQGRGKGKLRYEGQASQTRAPVRPGRRCCLLLWVLRGFYQRPDGAKILFPLPFILSPMIRPPPLLILLAGHLHLVDVPTWRPSLPALQPGDYVLVCQAQDMSAAIAVKIADPLALGLG